MDKWLIEISERLTTETVGRVIEHVEDWLSAIEEDMDESYCDGVRDTVLTIRELLKG